METEDSGRRHSSESILKSGSPRLFQVWTVGILSSATTALLFSAVSKRNCFLYQWFCLQNGNPQNPYCSGIEGVMEAYYQSLKSVRLYGPTHFSPVINHVAR